MNLTQKVADFISGHNLIRPDQKVVAGFSGGPDSICLLLILRELFKDTAAVYINHNLRGQESKREEEFVRRFCDERNIPLFVESLQWKSIPANLEEAARRKRYLHYSKVAAENGFDRVALGHQKDDVAETFLFRLIRGSGPRGLGGIPRRRGIYVRPLLACSRQEILEFLKQNQISFFTDSTNRRLNFQRNRIRNELIPYIRKNFNVTFPETLFRAINWIDEQNRLVEELMEPYKKLIQASSGSVSLDRNDYETLSVPLQKALLRIALQKGDPDIRISSRTLYALMRAIQQRQTMELPGFLQVQSEHQHILFSIKRHPGAIEVDVPSEGRYFFAPGNCFLQFSCPAEAAFGSSEDVAVVDLEKASFPLYIRNARKGDRFQPLGMNGHKKLSDFLIDRKIPRGERKSIPLVFKNDDLLWVAGHQMDENFRITPRTKKFLRIELQKNV